MQKLNLHVLTLLAALVFCVCLVNMGTGVDLEKSAEGGTHIPTLSSSVVNYNQQLILPVEEDSESVSSNEYRDIIKFELEHGFEIESQVQEESTKPVSVVSKTKPSAPSVTKDAKKAVVKKKKKKNYVERWAVVTAYCPCSKCCGYATPGRTSTGSSAWRPE